MSAVMALRSKYQEDFVKRYGFKLGFMSFFVKAAVQALREVPVINSQIDGDTLVQNHYYDIGVAVSTEKGLMVPVVRNCDTLGMAGIEKAITDAAGRAREGKITLADLEGGVFTITNLSWQTDQRCPRTLACSFALRTEHFPSSSWVVEVSLI